ncbi:hypothetical protein MY11210_007750 [Beauveria gryllotalpidicola]
MNRLGFLALALFPSALATECNANNCARAVTGTRRGDDFVTLAQGDCSRFMQETSCDHHFYCCPSVTTTITTTLDAAPTL